MKPASPTFTAAIAGVLALALYPSTAPAQTSTYTETTTTNKTVTSETLPAKVSTEIDFLPASTANDLNVQMLRDFAAAKQADPAIASAIARNPSFVNDAGYVGKHPALQAFLDKYPDGRADIVANPGNFVTPVPGSKWNSHEVAGIPRD